jgi:hypothetical protein
LERSCSSLPLAPGTTAKQIAKLKRVSPSIASARLYAIYTNGGIVRSRLHMALRPILGAPVHPERRTGWRCMRSYDPNPNVEEDWLFGSAGRSPEGELDAGKLRENSPAVVLGEMGWNLAIVLAAALVITLVLNAYGIS